MAIDGLNGELLSNAAFSGEPIRLERRPYIIEIFVRRMEAFELEEILAEEAEAQAEYRVHPITRNAPLNNKARSVGR